MLTLMDHDCFVAKTASWSHWRGVVARAIAKSRCWLHGFLRSPFTFGTAVVTCTSSGCTRPVIFAMSLQRPECIVPK